MALSDRIYPATKQMQDITNTSIATLNNTIINTFTPASLADVHIAIADFAVSEDLTIISGGLNTDERTITT